MLFIEKSDLYIQFLQTTRPTTLIIHSSLQKKVKITIADKKKASNSEGQLQLFFLFKKNQKANIFNHEILQIERGLSCFSSSA